MAPKTGAPQGKKNNIQMAAIKAVEKKKTCRPLPNPALATLGHSLAPGMHKKKHVTRSFKARMQFPIGWIGCYLKEGQYSQRIGFGAPIYLASVLECLAAKVLELTGQAAKDNKKIHIIMRHVMLGIMRDEDLSKLLAGSVLPNIHESLFGDGTMEEAAKLPMEDSTKSHEKTAESP